MGLVPAILDNAGSEHFIVAVLLGSLTLNSLISLTEVEKHLYTYMASLIDWV